MEFFPMYVEQIEENEQFKKLSPLKKCFYFLLQSRFNKQGEFYCRDLDFAAALNSKGPSIKAARREFAKSGWIEVVPGHWDSRGRNLSTVYKHVKWSDPPKKGDNKQFFAMQRYAFEMLLRGGYSRESIIVYLMLNYWRGLHSYEEGDFFIQKNKLRELTNIESMTKIEKCLEELSEFEYSSGNPLFVWKDRYHSFHFDKWMMPADPMDDEGSRALQKKFWDSVAAKGKAMQEEERKKAKRKEIEKVSVVWDMFQLAYMDKYQGKPQPFQQEVEELMAITTDIGIDNMEEAIKTYFKASSVTGIAKTQRRTLGKFLSIKYWEVK